MKIKYTLGMFLLVALCQSQPPLRSEIVKNIEQARAEIVFSIKQGKVNVVLQKIKSQSAPMYILYFNQSVAASYKHYGVFFEQYITCADLGQDILILSTWEGGNACPKKLRLIAIDTSPGKEPGVVFQSGEFGNCHESPWFIVTGERLTINFPWARNPTQEVWYYDGSRLIKK
jgi:hypothetical protein